MSTVASDIIKETTIRLKALDLEEANDVFSEENIPSTIRDGSFRVYWLQGTLDLESPGINRKFTVTRPLQILIMRRSMRTGGGTGQKVAVSEAYDVEERVVKDLLTTRINTGTVELEQLSSMDTQPTVLNGDNWLLTTIVLNIKYKLTV